MGEALLIEAPRNARRKPRSAARPKPLYRQLPARGRRTALDRAAVSGDQRARLIGAMIEEVAERGYDGATLTRLVALAGVSKRAFHEQFGTKQEYFLATYEAIVADAMTCAAVAHRSAVDPRAGLRAAFAACAQKLAEEPKAARVVLVEAVGAGPAALAPMRRTRQTVERTLGASLGEALGGVSVPPLIVTGIVCGLERIARRALLAGELERLPALADGLLAWALECGACAARVPAAPSGQSVPPAPCCPRPRAEGEWARILRRAGELAAARGRDQLSAGRIALAAGIDEARFAELFESTEQCFLDALDRLWLRALVCAARAAEDGAPGPAAVYREVAALMRHIATDPVLVQVVFVELPALGPAGVERREALLDRLSDQLERALPSTCPDSRLVARASAGAIWGIVRHHVALGATGLLPGLADQISYLVLAPAIGGDAAVEAILAASGKPFLALAGGGDLLSRGDLARVGVSAARRRACTG